MIAKLRLLMLPITEIDKQLPEKGLVYEIGSGWGSLAASLATAEKNRQVIGLDTDEEKNKSARQRYLLPNLKFITADALSFTFQKAQGVVMSDFLHHLSFTRQEKLITNLTNKLPKNARLVIKEIDKDEIIRRWFSRLWDFLLYPHDRIYYRSSSAWVKLLKNNGFSIRIVRAVRWFPGSTCLFICSKN